MHAMVQYASAWMVWVVMLVCFFAAGHAAGQIAPPTQPDPRAYRVLQERSDRILAVLPNRMIVIVQSLPAAPVVSAQIWVKTGSIYEQQHVGAGLSHFLEHLVSGGTTDQHSESESNAILGSIGAQTNAATSLATVRYYINTTSNHANEAIDLLSDWLGNAKITQEEFERERQVIQSEFASGQGDAGRVLWKLTQQARYEHHPARHPTIGYIDEFNAITHEEIQAFYKQMYVPNNMVFVVVGDVDKQAVLDRIADHWSPKKPSPLPELSFPIESVRTDIPPVVGVADIQRPRLRMAWPGTKLGGEGDYALDLLAVILGQGEASRLVQSVRDQQRLVDSIQAYNQSFSWGRGFFGIDAQVAVTDNDPAAVDLAIVRTREAIVKELERIKTQGISPEELARAKRQILSSVLQADQTAQDLAARLARDVIGMADPDYLTRYAAAIDKLESQDLVVAANEFLNQANTINITLMPADESRPIQVQTRPEQVKSDDVKYEPVYLDNALTIEKLGLPGVLENQAAAPVVVEPPKLYLLPNGLRLLVGKSNLVPAVSVQMYHLGGALADPQDGFGTAYATSLMRMKGTRDYTAQQLAEKIESLGASLSTGSGNNTSMTTASCLKQDLPTILALFAQVTLSPTFPEDEWQKLAPRLVAAIQGRTDSWYGELNYRFRQSYFGDYPWSVSPLGEVSTINALTPQAMRAFHQAHLGAKTTVMAVFGDVDPDAVYQQVLTLFGDMPAEEATEFVPSAPEAPTAAIKVFHTAKPMSAVQVGFGPGVTRQSRDYPAVVVLSRVLSSFPSGLLEQQLRGQGKGLVYAVFAGQFTGVVPGYFAIVFNSSPPRVIEALDRSMRVIEQVRKQPVDEQQLQNAKAAVLSREFLGKQSNDDRAAEAALNVLYGLGLDEAKRFETEVNATTPDLLQAIAQAYLRDPVVVMISNEPAEPAMLEQAVSGSRTEE